MSGLYELSNELMAIHNELADADGELTPIRESILDRIRKDLPKKEAQWVKWYQNTRAEEVAFDAEMERLRRKRDARRHLLEFIKGTFQAHMEQHGLTRIETPIGAVRLQRNSQPKLEHTLLQQAPMGGLPPDAPISCYDVIPEHFELNEKRLRELLAHEEALPNATLTVGQHIRIG